MLVKDWMSADLVTVNVDTTLQEAINILMDNHISILPVMDSGKLVGIVTDRDVKHASPSDACLLDFQNIMYHVAKIQLSKIMTPNPITVPMDLTIEETAEVLLQNNISGVPVVDEQGRLKGIITKDDIFAALVVLTGLSHRGALFGFQLEDSPGTIKQVTDVIRQFGGRLASIVSTYEMCPEGFRNVSVRAFNLPAEDMDKLLDQLKQKARLLYYVDHQGNKREFFE
jgi:acetoin utilization protein AcuB